MNHTIQIATSNSLFNLSCLDFQELEDLYNASVTLQKPSSSLTKWIEGVIIFKNKKEKLGLKKRKDYHPPKEIIPVEIRFSEKVYFHDSGCWHWCAARNEHGYGVLGRGGRGQGNYKAHRVSFQIFNEKSPTHKEHICHHCDNPQCVNPNHLFLGDVKANMDDMFRKGRNSPPPLLRGVDQPKAKLDDEKIRKIFSWHAKGISTNQIADQFGVTQTTINYVLKRKTWRHVNV